MSLKVTGDNELVSAQQIQTPMIAAQEIAQTRVFKRDPGTPSNNSKIVWVFRTKAWKGVPQAVGSERDRQSLH